MELPFESALARLVSDQPDVDAAAIFGSAATGRLRPSSDIDIYVRLKPGIRRDLKWKLDLEAALSRVCRREVDLVVEDDRTSVILRREVALHGRPIFEARPGAWTDLRASAVLAYVDLEPYMRLIGGAIREAVRRG